MIVVVVVAPNPVVVVTDAVERLNVVSPDGFETHSCSGCVQVRLERCDLGGLLQHGVGMQLLIGFHGLDVDIDTITKPEYRSAILRRVAFGLELKSDLEMGARVAAI